MENKVYKEQNIIKTRIAPSPTGDWHLGTVRTALFTYLFARHHHGKFYLRIEDTDRNRFVEGAEAGIHALTEWLGIQTDPYPDGQPFHRQSENLKRYQEIAQRLVQEGKAYYCFATGEELEAMRQEQESQKLPPRYDNRWGYRDLSYVEAQKRADSGAKYVIRQKMPQEGEIRLTDLVHGEVTFQAKLLDDHVILKSDGYPTYHLAHVVDDHDSEITHVIRGDEWLPSAPKHIVLHEALGWELPEYAHVPIILGPDKGKLSKRHGAKPALEYKDAGYLPEALINFLALLGWSSGTDKEVFTKDELITAFTIDRVQSSPAVFDATRLDWFNGHYIRSLSVEKLREKLLDYWQDKDNKWQDRFKENPEFFDKVVASLQDRLVTLREFAELAEFYYSAPETYDASDIPAKKQSPDQAKQALVVAREALQTLSSASNGAWNHATLESTLRTTAEKNEMKAGDILWPVRVALTGLPASPSTFEVLEILGPEESLKRIDAAIASL